MTNRRVSGNLILRLDIRSCTLLTWTIQRTSFYMVAVSQISLGNFLPRKKIEGAKLRRVNFKKIQSKTSKIGLCFHA